MTFSAANFCIAVYHIGWNLMELRVSAFKTEQRRIYCDFYERWIVFQRIRGNTKEWTQNASILTKACYTLFFKWNLHMAYVGFNQNESILQQFTLAVCK